MLENEYGLWDQDSWRSLSFYPLCSFWLKYYTAHKGSNILSAASRLSELPPREYDTLMCQDGDDFDHTKNSLFCKDLVKSTLSIKIIWQNLPRIVRILGCVFPFQLEIVRHKNVPRKSRTHRECWAYLFIMTGSAWVVLFWSKKPLHKVPFALKQLSRPEKDSFWGGVWLRITEIWPGGTKSEFDSLLVVLAML